MACLQRFKICLAVGARRRKGFNWTDDCTLWWERGGIFLAGQRVRPLKPNGYEFGTGANGQAGTKEPRWAVPPAADMATPQDGSINWQRFPISNQSLRMTIQAGQSVWTVEPTGQLLIEDAQIVNTDGRQHTFAFFNANAAAPGIYVVRNDVTFSDNTEGVGIYEVEVEA